MPQLLSTSEKETEITLSSSGPSKRGLREFHYGKGMIHFVCLVVMDVALSKMLLGEIKGCSGRVCWESPWKGWGG